MGQVTFSLPACIMLYVCFKLVGVLAVEYVYALPTSPFGNESIELPCSTRECQTLQEVSSTYNFVSNTTLLLLPGTHEITRNTSLYVENVQHFAIIGLEPDSSSSLDEQKHMPVTIQCLNSITFIISIRNSANLLLSRFEMRGCSGDDTAFNPTSDLKSNEKYKASIKISRSSDVILNSVRIYKSNEVGLWLAEVYNSVKIMNSEFLHSLQNLVVKATALHGDLMYGQDSTTNSKTFIHLMISDTIFHSSKSVILRHRVTIQLQTSNLPFEIYIQNVTFISIDDPANNLNLALYSRGKVASTLSITKLKSLTTANSNEGVISGFGYCNYGGLSLQTSGRLITHIADSLFKGPGSCISLSADNGGITYVYINKSSFIEVQCQCETLNFGMIHRVELHEIEIINSSQSIKMVRTNITFNGNCLFQRNIDGLELYKDSNLFIESESNIIFENNVCSYTNILTHCSILKAEHSNIVILNNSSTLFRNNSGTGIIVLLYTDLVIFGNTSIVFDSNSGNNGGALYLYATSTLTVCMGRYFFPPVMFPFSRTWLPCAENETTMLFVNNHAIEKGGGIFIDDSSYLMGITDSLQEAIHISDIAKRLSISFINNTANIAGSAIYGGWIVYKTINNKAFDYSGENDLSVVASNLVRVCLCKSSLPQCNISEHQTEMYPGGTVKLDVVSGGQRYGVVPSIVYAKLNDPESNLKEGQYIQEVYKNCTTLQYTIFSLNRSTENIVLSVKRENTPSLSSMQQHLKHTSPLYVELNILLYQQFQVKIIFKDCPLGFLFNDISKKCSCHPILNEYQTFQCDIETLMITKPSQKWINATFIHNLENDSGVIVNDHCPFDYCKQNSTHISLNLEYPDDQCDFNRSGILCGSCQNNFSHVLGSTKCKKCSSLWTILLVPVVAIVGVLLIVAMLGLNLTVSTGMLNGLILFANILRANHSTFFNSNSFLSYFIAWLNLDFGIEMCFYDGLDAYVKTWLQFIFPLYIWTIMIILIALSRRYVFVVRLCGSNVVQVLATLFLLSYAKLIRTIITIFQSTTLVYPDGYKRRVWLYDGNVDYLRGKHIPLFIAGLILLLFLSIPYTISLLFIQWLRKYNHLRLLRWVGKLKPLFDAYTGPFKEKHCYWFGVLLLVRVALYLVFSLNISGDTSLNLMAIGTTTACIFSYLVVVGGVYESSVANITDVSFMLNLIILTMGAHFYNNPQGTSTVSVSIAFCQFILITLYHLYLRITETRKGRQWNETLQTKLKQLFTSQRVVSMRGYFAPPVRAHRQDIYHHSIELKEPLLVDVTDSHK